MTELTPAVALVRVSSAGQVDKYGIDAQIDRVTQYAAQNGYDVVHIVKGLDISGGNDLADRDDLLELVEYLDTNLDVTTVIVPELSRLARDLMVQETIIDDLRKRAITILSALEPDLCSDDPSRKLIRQIIGAINEYNKSVITRTMRGGRIQRAKQGQHPQGRIPIGFVSVRRGREKTLEKVDSEIEIVRTIFFLRDKRAWSFQRIADHLNDAGKRPKNWTPEQPTKFHNSTVQKIYKNPKYRGLVTLKDAKGTIVASGVNDELRVIDYKRL